MSHTDVQTDRDHHLLARDRRVVLAEYSVSGVLGTDKANNLDTVGLLALFGETDITKFISNVHYIARELMPHEMAISLLAGLNLATDDWINRSGSHLERLADAARRIEFDGTKRTMTHNLWIEGVHFLADNYELGKLVRRAQEQLDDEDLYLPSNVRETLRGLKAIVVKVYKNTL